MKMLNQKLGRILCEQRQVTLPKVKQLTFLGGRDAGGTEGLVVQLEIWKK